MTFYDPWLEKGMVPDFIIRYMVRRRCRERENMEYISVTDKMLFLQQFVEEISNQPLAIATHEANRQHYEVSTRFFEEILGVHMKYSCCYWQNSGTTGHLSSRLEKAERAMLDLTCARAQIKDDQDILELGCGWGSLSLYIAERFPDSRITAVSNSNTQVAYVQRRAREKKLINLKVIKSDMNDFNCDQTFDRVISVEMFEHMRNYRILFRRISKCLRLGGKLFFHIFTYAGTPYLYDGEDETDWMARNFFAGGMMPCPELPFYFSDAFAVEKVWNINGKHYQKTLEAWLHRMDEKKSRLYPLFTREYSLEARKFWNHWRIFFMSCAEVFGYKKGNRWYVTHYLFKKVNGA